MTPATWDDTAGVRLAEGVLKTIPGIEPGRDEPNRMGSRCCGAGGGYKCAFNDMAVNIAAERVKEAVDTGADILATTCPFCVVNLQAGAKQIGAKIKIVDIAELLLEATDPNAVPAAGEGAKAAEPKAARAPKAEGAAKTPAPEKVSAQNA